MSIRSFTHFAWHALKRDGVNSALSELQDGQWQSPAALERAQHDKLVTLLDAAARNVPYYADHLRDAAADLRAAPYDALASLPVLTKDTIRANADSLVSRDLAGNALIPNSTSGSTGETLKFFTDANSDRYRKAAEIRSDSMTGWELGQPVIRLWGASIDENLSASLRGKIHGWLTANRFLSSFDLSEQRMEGFIAEFRRMQPVLLVAYPGPLERFARFCLERGVRFPSLQAIVSSAEMLWPHQRSVIEKAFGIAVFNRYGCREVGQIASECSRHSGLHLSIDRFVVEIVDDQYQPCRPGDEGRILVTDLHNFGMPFIRYDIGDRAALDTATVCDCGRGLPLLREIAGRTMDVVSTPDGRQVGGTFWTLLLRSRPGIRQFQVVQELSTGVVIRFVRDGEFEQSTRDYFCEKIRAQCGEDFNVRFDEVETIELTGSGKQRLVVSELHDDGSA